MPLKTKSAPKEHLGLTTRQKMKKYRAFYIMFIPLFLCLILFSYLPMFGILYAFTDYTPFKPAQFVGLQNFQKLFSQAGFWKAFFNTLQISITKLVIDTLGSIVLALLLDELHFKWFKKISQTIIYIPHFMSWVVVASIFTMFLSPKNGLINGVITALGGDSIYFLANEKWWRPIFYMIAVWKDIGWGTIIYIAALSGVDMEQHEAAVLDGATRFQRVIYLTLPAISGTIVTVFILNLAKVLNLFDPVWVLQNSITPWLALTPMTATDKNVEVSQEVTDSLAVVSANAKNISVFPVSEQRTMITSDLTTTRENIISRVAMGQLTPEEGMAEYKAQAETLNVAQALEEMNANA